MTTETNAPDVALLWARWQIAGLVERNDEAQEVMDGLRRQGDVDVLAEAFRAGQAHERRADAGLLAVLTAHNVTAGNGDVVGIADEMEYAAGTLEAFIGANEEADPMGLLDCTDNDGEHYQSEWMGGMMDHAKFGAVALRKWATTIRAAINAAKGHDNEG